MTVRAELEKATGIKAKKSEDAAAFRLRLIEAVSGLDDEDYEALPKAARKWSDDAIRLYETDRKLEDIPDFPAAPKAAEEEPESEPEEEEAEEAEAEDEGEEGTSDASEDDEEVDEDDDKQEDDEVTHTDVAESTSRRGRPKTKVAAKAAKGKGKKVAAKPEKAAKPAKAKKAAEGGKGLDFARGLLAKDIDMSATDLREKVAAAGYEVSDSTLSTGASGFRAAVRALQKAGKLKSAMLD
jgi:hypothetical protein